MIIGVPKEIKRDEYRVGLLPVGVEELTRAGHHVLVETRGGAGLRPDRPGLRPTAGRKWSARPRRSSAGPT